MPNSWRGAASYCARTMREGSFHAEVSLTSRGRHRRWELLRPGRTRRSPARVCRTPERGAGRDHSRGAGELLTCDAAEDTSRSPAMEATGRAAAPHLAASRHHGRGVPELAIGLPSAPPCKTWASARSRCRSGRSVESAPGPYECAKRPAVHDDRLRGRPRHLHDQHPDLTTARVTGSGQRPGPLDRCPAVGLHRLRPGRRSRGSPGPGGCDRGVGGPRSCERRTRGARCPGKDPAANPHRDAGRRPPTFRVRDFVLMTEARVPGVSWPSMARGSIEHALVRERRAGRMCGPRPVVDCGAVLASPGPCARPRTRSRTARSAS